METVIIKLSVAFGDSTFSDSIKKSRWINLAILFFELADVTIETEMAFHIDCWLTTETHGNVSLNGLEFIMPVSYDLWSYKLLCEVPISY